MERTFTFKVDGNKLTGETVSSFAGKSSINEGKVEGDNLSFKIVINIQGNQVEAEYKGKVTGDTIKLTSSFGDQQFEWSGKRAQ
jgi:hypothetical protein